MAQRLARIPALRQHGIDRLGQEIARLDALPPLNEAAREGRDLQVLQGARSASLAAGDTAAARQ